jgi:hypothetical protein
MSEPISPGMRELLETMQREGGAYAGAGRGNNVSRLISLRRRGLVESSGQGGRWHLTNAGRALLESGA